MTRVRVYDDVPVAILRAVEDPVTGDVRAVRETVIESPIDMISREMTPRALYSERRYMETLTPTRLGAYLILRAVYFRLPDRIAMLPPIRRAWRLTRGKD